MIDYFITTNLEEILFEIVNKLDNEMAHCSDTNDIFRQRIAVAQAYNEVIKTNHYTFYDPIEPIAHEIEPKDSVSLNDTTSCPFSERHDNGCRCFGRGYITIRMLSDQGIINCVKDKKKQEDYLTLKHVGKLPLKTPKITNHVKRELIVR